MIVIIRDNEIVRERVDVSATKIYNYLRNVKTTKNIREITKACKLHRANTYDKVDELVALGFIQEVKLENGTKGYRFKEGKKK